MLEENNVHVAVEQCCDVEGLPLAGLEKNTDKKAENVNFTDALVPALCELGTSFIVDQWCPIRQSQSQR